MSSRCALQLQCQEDAEAAASLHSDEQAAAAERELLEAKDREMAQQLSNPRAKRRASSRASGRESPPPRKRRQASEAKDGARAEAEAGAAVRVQQVVVVDAAEIDQPLSESDSDDQPIGRLGKQSTLRISPSLPLCSDLKIHSHAHLPSLTALTSRFIHMLISPSLSALTSRFIHMLIFPLSLL